MNLDHLLPVNFLSLSLDCLVRPSIRASHPNDPSSNMASTSPSYPLVTSSNLDKVSNEQNPPKPPITAVDLRACLTTKCLEPVSTIPKIWTTSRVTHWAENPIISLLQSESISELLHNSPGQMSTSLEFITAGLEGKVVGYREVSGGKSITRNQFCVPAL